ncbi:AMP-binding protein [Natronomonas sp. CBA1123]|uniref:class I adenylate-forming enzyme family protein n=1 Tax=Natronomonas sp. CBA1123 TaxID=2668070 RepID=UPI0012EA6B4E|nr:class I adenylate-forming enzyme family protein [Natronomonas sp. CBA1123]MUV87964.1 AMP-binding protein [Natronomonas sp. CBA1123]
MKYFQQEPLRHVGDVPAMGAERYGEKLAFEYRGEEYSYADLEARSNRVANALADAGIEPGDRVALYLENSLQFPETFFGVIKAGAVAVPLNHRMDTGRLKYILADADAAALVTSPVFPSVGTELAEEVPLAFIPGGAEGLEDYDEHVDSASTEFDRPDRDFEDVAVQCYTSGTTGDPKGVLTTHENLLSTVQSYTSRGGSDPEEDVALCFLPLFHMYGLSVVMLTGLYNGATVVLRTMPVASELLSAITEFEVTQFAGIPAVYIEMLAEMEDNPEEYDVSSLETLGSGAAPLADDTRRRIEDAFDTPLTEGWGMTETSPAGTTSSTYGVHKGAGCIGQPLPNVELKLVDPMTREVRVPAAALDPTSATTLEDHGIGPDDEEQVTGELAIRGPQVFEGYHGLPEKTEAVFDDEGWFYTDDIARVDSDRFLWMVDRADDMLIVGGENVYPAEVEDALFEHPDVQAAAVVGADHEVKGEAPVAYVVFEPGVEDPPTEREIREFALEHVATYAHPRRVFFVDELPRSGTRKVQRYKLEEDAAERLEGALSSSEEL